MADKAWSEQQLEGVALVGASLAPFFLEDPLIGAAGPSFEAMRSLDVQAAGGQWPFVDAEAARGCLRQMQQGLAEGEDDNLAWEYRRLFVGPAKKAAPPWGSVYTDRDQVIFGKSTLDLRQWMRERGVARRTDDGDPEDHIGLLLELMVWLAQNRPADLDEFLSLHLLTWAPHFLQLVERVSTHPFYQGLARLSRLSLEGIRDARGLVVAEPRFYR